MKKEEMAKAYAEGFAKEYREIAYDAFLCGYGAKCSTEIPNDLEEAAWDCVLDSVDVNNPVLLPKYKELLTYLFIAGAKWDRGTMLKEAVEGEIITDNRGNNVVRAGVFNKNFEYGDKVLVIIVKEDEK